MGWGVCGRMISLYGIPPPPPPHSAVWLPRLERLSELRKLETFERNVLLVLTGSMVSRNLRNPGNLPVCVCVCVFVRVQWFLPPSFVVVGVSSEHMCAMPFC